MSKLDMSLEDMIKMNKKSRAPNPTVRAQISGPARRFPNRIPNRSTPYPTAKVRAPDSKWQHDMFAVQEVDYPVRVARVSEIETGTKLFVSNLDYGVSDEDIKELFSEAGDLKRYSIQYDGSGRSKGTAEVVFTHRRDAEAAVKRYDNVELDGKPMKIETAGKSVVRRTTLPRATTDLYGNQNGAPRSKQGKGGVIGRSGGGSRGFTRAPEQDKGRGQKISAEDLDADLEKYYSEAMQTNQRHPSSTRIVNLH